MTDDQIQFRRPALGPRRLAPESGRPSSRPELAPAAARAPRPSLLGELPPHLAATIAGLPAGDEPYRARQLFRWLHARRARDFAAMSNLPAVLRTSLGERFAVGALERVAEETSAETATRKFVLAAADGARIETVRIETPRRVTLCVSSQVGCGFGCRFCRTAAMGFVRQLSAAEIVDQVYTISALAPLPERVNIVFMGMGEPLANYDQVVRAIDILTHQDGFALSPRRITVSTVGVIPAILRLARERPRVRLAVSLAATTDEARSALMPVNRRYSLAALARAVAAHAERTGQRATFEYVLLASVNDTLEDARRLARIANQVPSKVNLIPYNPTGLPGFERADDASMERFAAYLEPRVAAVTIRQSQGKDIFAACGQLAQPVERRHRRRGAGTPAGTGA
jgi:23S rRNA (adenine2503-C2)-methyltransferase